MRLAALALALVLAGCIAPSPGPGPESPISPLWAVSPLPTQAVRYSVRLPMVEGREWTLHCWALDRGADWRAQVAQLGEGECGHIWWTPVPLPESIIPACRSVAECERLDVQAIAQAKPGTVVLLLNESNNPDTAGGGWPVDAATAALRLRPVIAKLRAAGLQAACCGLYVDKADSLGAAAWWKAYAAAGGQSDVRHYHIFGRTVSDARAARAKAEAAMPGPWIVSESGWCRGVADYVQGIESPRYVMTAALVSSRGC